jgi:hypothetical protein
MTDPDRTRDLPRGLVQLATTGARLTNVTIDSTDITHVVQSITIRARRGSQPVVVLELTPAAVVVSTTAGVDVRLPLRRQGRVRAVLDSDAAAQTPAGAPCPSTPNATNTPAS